MSLTRREASRDELLDVVPAWFATRMHAKLALNHHKASWRRLGDVHLVWLLLVEVGELVVAMATRAPADEVVAEAADVANFSMMIGDNWRLRAHERLVGQRVRVIAPDHPQQGMVGTVRAACSERQAADVYFVIDLANGDTAVLHAAEFAPVRPVRRFWPWPR